MAAAGAAGAAVAGAATAPAPTTLLSLPEETLAKLFALLIARPGVALGRIGIMPTASTGTSRMMRDARALAAAHPRLDRVFRCELVMRLEMSWWAWRNNSLSAALSVHGRFPSSEVQRALQRHPGATALALEGHWAFCRNVNIAACVAPRLTVVELKSLTLDRLDEGGGVAALLTQCRELEELRLVKCRPKLSDDDLRALVSAVGPQLRVLSLAASAHGVTDAGGARLRDLTALTDLNLDSMDRVGEATFRAVATLPLLASLNLTNTDFSEEHAAATLPRMRALRELNVSYCDGVGPRLWAALPPTLRVLHANYSSLLAEAPGDACAAALVKLHVVDSRNASWAALTGPHVRALRILTVTRTFMGPDAGADAALEAMPQLEGLDLSSCWNVGDGTAAAITRHAALRVVVMRGTGVSREGVRDLRRWEADGNSAAVRGERMTAGRVPQMRRVFLNHPKRLCAYNDDVHDASEYSSDSSF